jgi:hypothetical protein
MKTIFYNAAVAKRCGQNGIIKAVLINYIFNYHKPNIRKGPGSPASISLTEFVEQYTHEDTPLWNRSWIHETLKTLEKDKHLNIARNKNMPGYSVSNEIAELLKDEKAPLVSFDLETACRSGIHFAIVSRFVLHVIKQSPKGIAYKLSVKEMAEVNRLSPAQIYREINTLIEKGLVEKVEASGKGKSRSLNLRKCGNEAKMHKCL